jgi:very-short-patch-repair endonuclease
MRINPPLPTRTRASATRLRAEMTDAERELWFRLRAGRLEGLKFRRQHPIPPYVVDFYCQEAGLVVEVDGSQHQPEVDGARTAALKRQGLEVLRFWDNEVFTELETVLEQILRIAKIRTLTRRSAPPSPGGRGEKQNGET